MLKEAIFQANDVLLNYAEGAANGSSIVLLHGGSARWQSFLPIIPELEERWHVFALDLRGHGMSGRTPGHYTLPDYVIDIASFLERKVKEPAILFGHSLGGQIGLIVAAQYPRLIKALIVGDSPFELSKLKTLLKQSEDRLIHWRDLAGPNLSVKEITQALKNTPIKVEGESESVAARNLFGEDNPWFYEMAENLRHNDPDMLDHVIEFDRMHSALDYQKLLPLISCPALLIQGNPAKGGMLSDAEIEQTKKLLPETTVARVETVGHGLHLEQKEPVLKAVLSFLDSL